MRLCETSSSNRIRATHAHEISGRSVSIRAPDHITAKDLASGLISRRFVTLDLFNPASWVTGVFLPLASQALALNCIIDGDHHDLVRVPVFQHIVLDAVAGTGRSRSRRTDARVRNSSGVGSAKCASTPAVIDHRFEISVALGA